MNHFATLQMAEQAMYDIIALSREEEGDDNPLRVKVTQEEGNLHRMWEVDHTGLKLGTLGLIIRFNQRWLTFINHGDLQDHTKFEFVQWWAGKGAGAGKGGRPQA